MSVGGAPRGIAVGDFNADGNVDLATLTPDTTVPKLVVLPGNGDGTFQEAASLEFYAGMPIDLVAAELSVRPGAELAVLDKQSRTMTMVVWSTSLGPLVPWWTVSGIGPDPESIAAADLNADGYVDLVAANSGDDSVSVALGAAAEGSARPLPTMSAGRRHSSRSAR